MNFTIGVICTLSDLVQGLAETQKNVFVGVNVGSNKIYNYSQFTVCSFLFFLVSVPIF